MVIQLHEEQCGQVQYGNQLSAPFPITNSVTQGCVLAPTVFTLFFSMVLKQATTDFDDQDFVYIQYHFDGSPFNLRRLQAHSKTMDQLIRHPLFAGDATLVAHSERALQCVTSRFTEAAQLLHLKRVYPPRICIGKSKLKTVYQFAYLCCTITSQAILIKRSTTDRQRLTTLGRFYKRVWYNKYLNKSTEFQVYRAVVLTILLYDSEP